MSPSSSRSISNKLAQVTFTLAALVLPTAAFAADGFDTGYTAWMLTATALVLFMTIPGLSLFYAGLVRSKNVLSVLMQCFAITCMASLIWIAVGYSLALNGDGAYLGSMDKFFLDGVGRDAAFGKIPESVWVMFQMTFAIITPALIVGGFAERMKFSAMLLFSAAWLILVYFPVCYWVWAENGWLFKMGLIDFAGGTVVHINAGVAALVAAVYLGKRKGFPTTAMLPHNLTMTVTGAGMLWVGWFGFNAGSAIASGDNLFRDAGSAMLVTHISAAAGSLAWMVLEWVRYRKPSVLGIVTGMVAGLGTITPASGHVGPMGALIIGLSAGVVCYFSTQFIKRKLQIDDSLDVFPVHGVGGILGTMAVGIFAFTAGGINQPAEAQSGVAASMFDQLGTQAIGVIATAVWSGVLSWIILKVVDILVGVRVTEEEETEGLDHVCHDETGYNDI
jgi:Amt family ammonium transporter